jgi:hypothetical protein
MEAELKRVREMHADVLNHELTVSFKKNTLASKEEPMDKEKRLTKKQIQDAMRKKMEELQTTREAKAEKVWDFLGQTETTLMPLGFSPLRSGEPVREVSTVLPMLEFVGAKMQSLMEVVGEQLEVEGRALAKKVV